MIDSPSGFAEELPLRYDIEALRAWLREEVLDLPPVMKSRIFGGWSILSHRADYRDGFQQSREGDPRPSAYTTDPYAIESWVPSFRHDQPTEICKAAIVPVLKDLTAKGFFPRRARVTVMKAGGEGPWHTDDADRKYSVRLHIPLITNPGCIFHYRNESHHFKAEGSAFLVSVNQEHRIVNQGEEDRYHIIMDVLDTRHLSRTHRFDPKLHALVGASVPKDSRI